MVILLSSLRCLLNTVRDYYQEMNIFVNGAPLRSRVNEVHFKRCALELHEIYTMKFTCYFREQRNGLLEYNFHLVHVKLFSVYDVTDLSHLEWNICKIWYHSFFRHRLLQSIGICIFFLDINMNLPWKSG